MLYDTDESSSVYDSYSSSDRDADYSDVIPVDILSKRKERAPIAPFTTYRLYGLDVEFPKDRIPFTSQKSTMTAIVKSLSCNQNAIIESPTGTGKTLALLCASLSWIKSSMIDNSQLKNDIESVKEELQEKLKLFTDAAANVVNADDSQAVPGANSQNLSVATVGIPTSQEIESLRSKLNELNKCLKKGKTHHIFYCSRTHTQLDQVIQELKRSNFLMHMNGDEWSGQSRELVMTILASKQHYCINEDVKSYSELSVDDICGHEHTVSVSSSESEMSQIFPFSRCPYRNQSKIAKLAKSLQGILDIEDMKMICRRKEACPYYVARELMSRSQIILAPYNYVISPEIRSAMSINLENTCVLFDEAHNILSTSMDAAGLSIDYNVFMKESNSFFSFLQTMNTHLLTCSETITSAFPSEAFKLVGERIQRMTKWCSSMINSLSSHTQTTKYRLESGRMMMDLLRTGFFTDMDDLKLVADNIEVITSWLNEMDRVNVTEELKENDLFMIRRCNKAMSVASYLQKSIHCMSYILDSAGKNVADFRLLVEQQLPQKNRHKVLIKDPDPPDTTFDVICLNASIVFEEIKRDCSSIILASGTLSPLSTFSNELNMTFSNQIEGMSSVDVKRQLYAAVVPAYHGVTLLGDYQTRSTETYMDAIGDAIVDCIKVIPEGVVCFFPSYMAMDQLVKHWKKSGCIDRIKKVKRLFIEQRSVSEFNSLFARYTSFLSNYNDGVKRGIKPSSITGAILFGVCRGKVSEGIDFKDYMARGVIDVSIPFPNSKSHQVNLMKEYMDMRNARDPSIQTGNSWYEEQAFRALNQGLGRCIRHSRDYGAIIILDSRFVSKRMQRNLSRWFRDSIRVVNSDHHLIRDLKAFYASCKHYFDSSSSQMSEESISQDMDIAKPTQKSPYFNPSQQWHFTPTITVNQVNQVTYIQQTLKVDELHPSQQMDTESTQSIDSSQELHNLHSQTINLLSTLSAGDSSSDFTESNELIPSRFSSSIVAQSTQPSIHQMDRLFRDSTVPTSQEPLPPQSAATTLFLTLTQPSSEKRMNPNDEPTLLDTQLSHPKRSMISVKCPVCSSVLANTEWTEESVVMNLVNDLIQSAFSTLRIHGYQVSTPSRGIPRAKVCDASAILSTQDHFCFNENGCIESFEFARNSSVSSHSREQFAYRIIYCNFPSKTVKNGGYPAKVLIPIGILFNERGVVSDKLKSFLLLPLPLMQEVL